MSNHATAITHTPPRRFLAREKRAMQGKRGENLARAKNRLPEYLDPPHVEALIQSAKHAQAALAMLIMWRAGLRVSEMVALQAVDLSLESDRPTLLVRKGKGNKARSVPVHPELRAALNNALRYAPGGLNRKIIGCNPATAWTWIQEAYQRCVDTGTIPPGKVIGNHTLRHSAARHWLASGIPINVVQRWLGHANLSTTLIYLQILPDPLGEMERVP